MTIDIHLRYTPRLGKSANDETLAKPQGPNGSDKPKRAHKNLMKQIKLAPWNVTLSDAKISNRQAPERRSALVSTKLERLNIDIALLSECRIPRGRGIHRWLLTFINSGRNRDQVKQKGVAVALKNQLRSFLFSWKGINSCIMIYSMGNPWWLLD